MIVHDTPYDQCQVLAQNLHYPLRLQALRHGGNPPYVRQLGSGPDLPLIAPLQHSLYRVGLIFHAVHLPGMVDGHNIAVLQARRAEADVDDFPREIRRRVLPLQDIGYRAGLKAARCFVPEAPRADRRKLQTILIPLGQCHGWDTRPVGPVKIQQMMPQNAVTVHHSVDVALGGFPHSLAIQAAPSIAKATRPHTGRAAGPFSLPYSKRKPPHCLRKNKNPEQFAMNCSGFFLTQHPMSVPP